MKLWKHQTKKLQDGRSMVEMLGVLAIVGILSVGAIAGYQKAMFKYKLNKHAQQLNQVINIVAINARNFNDLSSTRSKPILPYLIKLGEIPTEMIKGTATETIYDIFNSPIYAYMQPYGISNGVKGVTSLFINFDISQQGSQSLEICRNIFNVIKENSGNIYYMYLASGYNTDDSRISSIYGDSYCTNGKKCLKKLSLQFIEQECSYHWDNPHKGGHFVVLWKL